MRLRLVPNTRLFRTGLFHAGLRRRWPVRTWPLRTRAVRTWAVRTRAVRTRQVRTWPVRARPVETHRAVLGRQPVAVTTLQARGGAWPRSGRGGCLAPGSLLVRNGARKRRRGLAAPGLTLRV